jgi:Ni2+-binding GTPase involved in maturation of urease and hydrogenase
MGTALSVALQLLPELKDRLNLSRREQPGGALGVRRLGWFHGTAVRAITQTARLADQLARADAMTSAAPATASARGRTIVAVIGTPHSGKTTLVASLVELLRRRGLRVGGITQPALFEGDQREGYRLRDAATGEEHVLARRRATPRGPGELGYDFDPAAWVWAKERLQAAQDVDVLVVDELGRLEARGEGHVPALVADHGDGAATPRVWLLGVRADCASAVAARIGEFDLTVTPGPDSAPVEDLAERIATACAERRAGDGNCACSRPSGAPRWRRNL